MWSCRVVVECEAEAATSQVKCYLRLQGRTQSSSCSRKVLNKSVGDVLKSQVKSYLR